MSVPSKPSATVPEEEPEDGELAPMTPIEPGFEGSKTMDDELPDEPEEALRFGEQVTLTM